VEGTPFGRYRLLELLGRGALERLDGQREPRRVGEQPDGDLRI
jgi:hypothetical protein